MKRRTKAQKFKDSFDAFKCLQQGQKVKRLTYKDGSIPTIPTIPCADKAESEVLSDCLAKLYRKRIFANRHEVGAGNLTGAGYATYGIKGAGDIIGVLVNGRHFEIECKRGKGGRLSKEQQKRKKVIEANEGIYIIAHSAEEMWLQLMPYIPIKSFRKGLEQC